MDHLTDQQKRELADDLRALKKELGALLEMSKDGAKPVALDQPIGRLSRMDAIQQQKMTASTRAACKLRLTQVGAALIAIEEATYGECLTCDEPIAFRRLKAKPETRVCVACQAAREQGM